MIYEPIWGAIIAWYLFLAGLGGGAFATAVFVRYRHPDCKRLMRVGRLIAEDLARGRFAAGDSSVGSAGRE